jgi:hypothetical protein
MADAPTFDPMRFGVRREDEHAHPFDPAIEWWNESWFWDWYDRDGTVAGHCRIGIHPNQSRVWLWLFLFRDGEWIAIEQPRLPLADLDLARLAYDRFGLRFAWNVGTPLESGRLEVAGFGRVLTGARCGFVLPVEVALDVGADGAAHALGAHQAPGHASQAYSASRFEQPITATGTLRVDTDARPFAGRGERDHSWGPRLWDIEWTFLAANAPHLRLQCVEARLPGGARFAIGYVQRDRMVSVEDIHFDLTARDDLRGAVGGRFTVRAEGGEEIAGTVETITATEIDLSHCLVPPRRSVYRRALVRLTPSRDASLVGWLELHRLPEWQ